MNEDWSYEEFKARVDKAESEVKYSWKDMRNLVKFCHRYLLTFEGMPDKVISDFLSSPEYLSKL